MKIPFQLVCLFAGILLGMTSSPAMAEVKPHALISDGMVLQQQISAKLWGTASPGEQVRATFRNRSAATTANADGRWTLQVDTGEAGGPFALTIAGTNTIEIKNVLVGEVWLASGQSNMGWPLATRAGAGELKATANPMIRLFTVRPQLVDEPQSDISGHWFQCHPDSLVGFSAVAYYFGRTIQSTQQVPVALIHASYGGSGVEAWTSAKTLSEDPGLALWREQRALADRRQTESQARVRPEIERYERALAEAKNTGAPLPTPPRGMTRPVFSRLYNAMVAPLTSYAIRGVIWYQGEANVPRATEYQSLFSAMIRGWRQDWGQGDFPFLFVQIAPFKKIRQEPQESDCAMLREAQRLTYQTVPHTGMAVITDWGHETDIHVKQKQPVGERLALVARAMVYRESIEYSGPEFGAMRIAQGQATLTFKHLGGGLIAQPIVMENIIPATRGVEAGGSLHVASAGDAADVRLQGFTIAGDDHKFVPALAEIRGDTVVVSSSEVALPKAVRYGWADYPTGNLFNRAGLPASPFRTDDW